MRGTNKCIIYKSRLGAWPATDSLATLLEEVWLVMDNRWILSKLQINDIQWRKLLNMDKRAQLHRIF